MENTSRTEPLSKRDIYYYRQRHKNRLFGDLAKFFAEEAESRGITKKDIANRLGCDPSLVTRLLSGPSNLTQESISDLLLALDAEMEFPIVRFRDRCQPNYIHSLIANATTPAPIIGQEGQKYRAQIGNITQSTGETILRKLNVAR